MLASLAERGFNCYSSPESGRGLAGAGGGGGGGEGLAVKHTQSSANKNRSELCELKSRPMVFT